MIDEKRLWYAKLATRQTRLETGDFHMMWNCKETRVGLNSALDLDDHSIEVEARQVAWVLIIRCSGCKKIGKDSTQPNALKSVLETILVGPATMISTPR